MFYYLKSASATSIGNAPGFVSLCLLMVINVFVAQFLKTSTKFSLALIEIQYSTSNSNIISTTLFKDHKVAKRYNVCHDNEKCWGKIRLNVIQ